jgi:hypothetical protein
MRIHLSAALLVGSIAATAGYVCSWQDGGFTYVDDTELSEQILVYILVRRSYYGASYWKLLTQISW